MLLRKWLLLFASVMIVGCSSQPRHVSATLPLVQHKSEPVGKSIPAMYRSGLEDSNSTRLQHTRYQILLGPLYTSALGLDCRELAITEPSSGSRSEPISRVACSEKKQYDQQVRAWYLMPNIIQTSTSVKL